MLHTVQSLSTPFQQKLSSTLLEHFSHFYRFFAIIFSLILYHVTYLIYHNLMCDIGQLNVHQDFKPNFIVIFAFFILPLKYVFCYVQLCVLHSKNKYVQLRQKFVIQKLNTWGVDSTRRMYCTLQLGCSYCVFLNSGISALKVCDSLSAHPRIAVRQIEARIT